MLIVSLCIFATGLLLLTLALRGRIAQRGQFCRKCRFDLAGIDLGEPTAQCPECGRAVSGGRRPRTVRRRRSRLLLGIATLLMLVFIIAAGISLSGSAAAVYRHMPERVVLNAAQWGSEPALDELITRSSKKDVLSDAGWQAAIEHALGLQSDESRVWDPRWGEVLYLGATGNHLRDEQLGRYVSTLDRVKVAMRSRVHAGTARLPMNISLVTDRGNAVSGGWLGLHRTLRITRAGVEGFERSQDPNGIGLPFAFTPQVQRNLGSMSMGMWPSIDITRAGRAPLAGQRLAVTIEYTVSIAHAEGEEPFFEKSGRFEQEIEVLPVDAEIVERAQPIGGVAAASRYFTIPDIAVTQPLPEGKGRTSNEMIAMFAFQKRRCPMAVAYRVYLRADSGQEFEIAQIVSEESPDSLSASGVMVNLRPGDDTGNASLLRAAGIMLDRGHATIVMRTTPDLAIDTPGIEQVMDLDLIFEDVPVVPSPPGQFNNSGAFGDSVAARALLDDPAPASGDQNGSTP